MGTIGSKGSIGSKKVQLTIKNFDEELKRRFRALCVRRGRSLKDEVERLMTEELKRARESGNDEL